MKTTFAAVLGLFAVSIAAAPTAPARAAKRDYPPVTFSLTNDASGANAAATIYADGTPYQIQTIFENSDVDVTAINDEILATSVQLTAFPQGVECVIQTGVSGAPDVADLSDEVTFVELVTDINIPLSLSGDFIICEV